jgi:hypothetical protein
MNPLSGAPNRLLGTPDWARYGSISARGGGAVQPTIQGLSEYVADTRQPIRTELHEGAK